MNLPIPNQYDHGHAALLACFAAAAYNPQPQIPGWTTEVIESRQTDTRALVACDGEDCLVAFRGTQDLRNWLTDLDCAFLHLGQLRVHRGFFAALESVRRELKASIAQTHCRRVWLTGHSLGGALAMLCARAWEEAVAGVYTFGQPRAGDAAFARDYNELLADRTFRVIRATDIVPRVPWLLGAYRHAGHEIFFPWPGEGDSQSGGRWMQDAGLFSKLPLDLANAVREWRHGQLALLDDHHISRYLALFSNQTDCFSPSAIRERQSA